MLSHHTGYILDLGVIRTILFLAIICSLGGCSGLEETEKKKIRERNWKGEAIYRNANDLFFPITLPASLPRAPYPWESEAILPRITKEFFRCKGNPLHDMRPRQEEDEELPEGMVGYLDCEGSAHHGLPILQGKEGVYPILLDLLNYVQKKLAKRVIITCGHRCPTHNRYADPSQKNRSSKHQIGAEVDFYVQGLEEAPQVVLKALFEFYRETPRYRDQKEYILHPYEKEGHSGALCAWINQEVFIAIHAKEEGRDFDNRHPYPYITIQVRYDRDLAQRVVYDWTRAHQGYPRGL
jgi:hypothetical protein